MSTTAATSENTAETIEERILEAALIQFGQVGVKKTTIEDIARKAGVDRVTVYRRVGARDDVVRAVTEREVRKLLADLGELPARHDTLEGLVVDVFATVLTRWRTHPLVQRMLTLEPDRLLPQLTTEGGAFFMMSVAATTEVLRNAMREKGFPEVPDLDVRVEVVCRIVHSLILQPIGAIDLDSGLTAFARDYIRPIITD
ncbi:TetR/AcrR family transcriptional regulator [Nocardia abscessus]|uniref:TetR/AcrR family transcriptional regulator n=1 Tax=Nocardia TaxID=1817 RepID=UPI001892D47B|nr:MULTISPECIES: TetR/AcrR family transcriptional regulator [Nocardia]MBF6223227.1 TetR/AcrR family transcriptional regulator [Nocardia abscessus]MDE1674281.1 helix-turn-helix domain containing protein [Nocardia gipuzkoensis]